MTTIKDQYVEAGISKSCYYYRRGVKGMSHEESLNAPPGSLIERRGRTPVRESPRVLRAKVDVVKILTNEGVMSRKDLSKKLPQHNKISIDYALSVLISEGLVVKCGRTTSVVYRLAEGVE